LPIAAIMVHARTLAQGFSGPVDYETINRVKKKFKGIVLANGGITDEASAREMLKKTGADGLGVGQGACGKPYIFEEIRGIIKHQGANPPRPRTHPASPGSAPLPRGEAATPPKEGNIFKVALEHAKLMKKLKGEQGIIEMRKHLCWYVKGLPGAAEIRQEFVKVSTLDEIEKIVEDYLPFDQSTLTGRSQ
jgi:tRNA-dihydrouridine synthase B